MESLPAQQVTEFTYSGELSKDSIFRTDLAFQNHSATLRKICIYGGGTVPSVMASTIFSGCYNLETLFIASSYSNRPYMTLADALEYPWVCIKLQQLSLTISGCELPVEPGVKPYYRRPTPITLTEVETQHFPRLEDLYRRIGALKDLRELCVAMIPLDEDEDEDEGGYDWKSDKRLSFPAMLNLQDARTGRPGFLQLLSGLKKLEKLQGSISAHTDETEVTVGRAEAIWMDQNWPVLQEAEFFACGVNVTEPFQWLEDKRYIEGRVALRTATFIYDEDYHGRTIE